MYSDITKMNTEILEDKSSKKESQDQIALWNKCHPTRQIETDREGGSEIWPKQKHR